MLLALLLAGAAGACADGDALRLQEERLDAEHQAQMLDLERLETRLITVNARHRAWNELQERHARISAIACEQAAGHVAAMEAHDLKQVEKRRVARDRRLANAQAHAETVSDRISAQRKTGAPAPAAVSN